MSDIPKWLEELRKEQPAGPKGNVALLRDIVRTREAQAVAGVEIPPEAADVMIQVCDSLRPADQELFAAECNADFRSLQSE